MDTYDMYTIAEIGINHNGDIDIAKKIIGVAAAAGFSAVKFQKRQPEKSTPPAKRNETKKTPWGDMTYLEYKKRLEFGYDEYCQIQSLCEMYGIEWFASVWDIESAEFMTDFCTTVKIPSACITNIELLDFCRDNYHRRIMSCGMSMESQIETAVEILDPEIIMHCNASYPAAAENLQLEYIRFLKRKYPDKTIGYSGHEYGIETTYAAVAMGAKAIERHVTLDHDLWGSDQKCSLGPDGMFKLIRGVKNCMAALGGYGPRMIRPEEMAKMEYLRQ